MHRMERKQSGETSINLTQKPFKINFNQSIAKIRTKEIFRQNEKTVRHSTLFLTRMPDDKRLSIRLDRCVDAAKVELKHVVLFSVAHARSSP